MFLKRKKKREITKKEINNSANDSINAVSY